MTWLFNAILFIASYGACIWFHEVGHQFKAKRYGCKTRIYFDWRRLDFNTEYTGNVTPKQEQAIILAGIAWGALPIFVLAVAAAPLLVFGGVSILYVLGCRNDFERLGQLGAFKVD